MPPSSTRSRTRASAAAAGLSPPSAPSSLPTLWQLASWDPTLSSSWWTAAPTVDLRAATVVSTSTAFSTLAPPALPPRAATHTRPWMALAGPALSPRHSPQEPWPVTRASAKTTQLWSPPSTVPPSPSPSMPTTRGSYRSGVLSKSCGIFGQIDHAVIAVGYDSSADTFKIRNSWGASWGEAGYVRISNSVSNPYCLYNTAPFVAQISADVTV